MVTKAWPQIKICANEGLWKYHLWDSPGAWICHKHPKGSALRSFPWVSTNIVMLNCSYCLLPSLLWVSTLEKRLQDFKKLRYCCPKPWLALQQKTSRELRWRTWITLTRKKRATFCEEVSKQKKTHPIFASVFFKDRGVCQVVMLQGAGVVCVLKNTRRNSTEIE